MSPGTQSDLAPASTLGVGIDSLCAAVRALSLATRYDEALELAAAAVAESADADALSAADNVRLALAAADAAERRDYVRGGDPTAAAWFDELAVRARALDPHSELVWDTELLAVRRRYAGQLRRPGGSPWFGPDDRDAAVVDALASDAAELVESAPDPARRGWARMCLGWIADNIRGDRDSAPPHYRDALDAGRQFNDDLLIFEAQRHLGDHAHDDGHAAEAYVRWSEATEAAARAGHLAGVLAQQLLLAVLAQDAEDVAGAHLLAGEVRRWSEAVGATTVAGQSGRFLNGIDPTRPPS